MLSPGHDVPVNPPGGEGGGGMADSEPISYQKWLLPMVLERQNKTWINKQENNETCQELHSWVSQNPVGDKAIK